ncbi:hypothetical protein KAM472_10050 [Aeromonas caviae]|nr:hypothetical protein KAM472_10050 [Aeromonas caviae]
MSPLPLLGFVAWSGTGKTTLLERLIPHLVARGLRLGVLKHTHHAFDMDQPGKDSHRLRQAGATQVMAASDRRHALIRETPEGEPPFEALLARFDTSALDLLLVEGFKHRRFPKVELYRAAIGRPLLFPDDPDIVALVSDAPQATTLPRFPFEDLEAIADFICARLPPSAEHGVVPGLLSQDEAGTLLVRPVDGGHDSANCRIERAPGSAALPPGERVMVRLPTGAPP